MSAELTALDHTMARCEAKPLAAFFDTSVPPDAREYFRVGDIIENTWGYGQTNWYFYKVLKVTKRFLVLHRLQDILVSGDRIWGGKVRPSAEICNDQGELDERHSVRWSKITQGKVLVKMRFGYGEMWDGRDKSITGYN